MLNLIRWYTINLTTIDTQFSAILNLNLWFVPCLLMLLPLLFAVTKEWMRRNARHINQLTGRFEARGLPRWTTPLLHWYDCTQTEFRSRHCCAGGAVGGGGGMYSFDRVGGGGGGGWRTAQQTSLFATLHCYKWKKQRQKMRNNPTKFIFKFLIR